MNDRSESELEQTLRQGLASLVEFGPDPAARPDFADRRVAMPIRQGRPRRTGLLVAAAVAVVAGGIAIAHSSGDQARVTVVNTDSTSTTVTQSILGAESLSVSFGTPSDAPLGSIRSATSEAELIRLWSDTNLPADHVPPINFDSEVVIALTFPDDGCPSEAVDLSWQDSAILAQIREPSTCTDPWTTMFPRTYILAFDFSETGRPFTVQTYPDPRYDVDGATLTVE